MAESKTVKFQFSDRGLITKEDPALLGDGAYRSMSSMEVIQEGSLSSRTGKKRLNGMAATAAYMVRKMVLPASVESPSVPSTNPRYVGIEAAGVGNLYRTLDYTTFTLVASGINTTSALTRRSPFSLASYATGGLGAPWAFVATETAMLKDRSGGGGVYASLLRWGILPAFGVALVCDDGGAAGLLDGGDAASPNGTQPYDYRFTFVSGDTNSEGNPSQTMLDGSEATQVSFGGDGFTYVGTPLAVNLKKIKVLVWGITASGVNAEIATINIYRRGGILFDAWRLVGSVANPGTGAQAAFIDNIADVDLESAQLLVTDNDPPIPSSVQGRAGCTGTIPATSAGRQTVTLSAGSFSRITPGTVIHCVFNNQEDVVVESTAAGGTQFTAYFQFDQDAGTTVYADTLTGSPGNLAITFQQFLIVAGNAAYNPHLLYRSKGDQPEAFSAAPADGTVSIMASGTPADPIVNLCEFRGLILTLNVSSLRESLVLNGSLTPASQVSNRGLAAARAWCKTETEVWYLASDGVWSWDGGTSKKRTEAIDPIFHNQEMEGFAPLDYGPNVSYAVMEYRRGQINLLYLDTDGASHYLACEPAYGDRWRSIDSAASFLYTEPDTQSLVEAVATGGLVTFGLMDQQVISGGINYTSDYFLTNPQIQGNPIVFDVTLPWFDFGKSHIKKLLQEAFLDADLTGSTLATLRIDIYVDYSDTAVDTLTVTLPLTGRTLLSLLPNLVNIGAHAPATRYSFGREARAFSYKISGTAYPTRQQFFSLTFQYVETGMLTAGATYDWMNLSHKYDKKLYQMTVEFDVDGTDRTIVLDTVTGRDGNVLTENVQEFLLSDPISPVAGDPMRALKTFPIDDGIIVKEVRVRPLATVAGAGKASTVFFRIFNIDFEKEDYPPDVVSFTPWKDDGYSYLKYANQVVLQVNTNGVEVTVVLQADGSDRFSFTVTATESDRERIVTVPTGLTGYQWRLFVDPAQDAIAVDAGMFQLFNYSIKFQQADKGEVGHTFDWDDLGHPYDKQLSVVTIEWDNTGGEDVIMELDLLTGIEGDTITLDVEEFTLAGGRSKRTFPLPVDLIVKMIRLHPQGDTIPASFKQWKYSFAKQDYPADIVLFTEWRNAETLNDKNPSNVSIDADTAGVVADVILENEAGTVLAFTHTGTVTDREKNYAIPPDVTAKMWRLRITPGTAGKFQAFAWTLSRWHAFEQGGPEDPPDVILFTPWKDFGYPYGKIARNLILTIDTGGVACSIRLQTIESGTVQTFSVTTTYSVNRRVILPCNFELIGTQWRLLPVAGAGGLSKLFDWDLETIKEPAAVSKWSSYQQGFGYLGFKLLFQLWIEYQCASPITVTFVSSTGTLVMNFPAHATRAAERDLFPSEFGSGLNKSILYDVVIESTVPASPVKLYADVSGIEWAACGVERRGEFQSMKLSEFMSLPI